MTYPSSSSNTAPPSRRNGELVGIQYLRGLAAMMVVVFHLKSQFAHMGYTGWWPGGLSSGVDIFFVISGFLMVITTANKKISPLTFWWRRIVRIVPLYWLVTAFMTVVLFIAPQALQTGAYDGWHLLASYLFVPAMHPVQYKMEPLVTPGWTLNYEMFFYLIFGIFLLAPRRVQFLGTVFSLLALMVVGAVFAWPKTEVLGFYTSTIMLEFVFGMVLGEIAVRGDLYGRVPRPVGWALLIGGLALLIIPMPWTGVLPRAFARGPFATAVVAGTLIIEANRKVRDVPLFHELGNASYSIYLTQIIATSALSQGWRLLGLHHLWGGKALFAVIDILLCAVVGWLCYRVVERALIRWLQPRGMGQTRGQTPGMVVAGTRGQ